MAMEKVAISYDEFIQFALRPENADRNFEFINGEIIELSPGTTSHSGHEHMLVIAIFPFCEARGIPCYTSGGDGAYHILGHVLAPDFAYKATPLSEIYPDPEPPLLVAEIISTNDRPNDIREKRNVYLEAGILYWELYPKQPSIDVYEPGKPVRTLNIDDVLDGGDVLPGLAISLRKIFRR